MTPLEILRGARELLAKPERWTKGECARRSDGSITFSLDDEATCFCLDGALIRLCGGSHTDLFHESWEALRSIRPGECPIRFNDHPNTTHADILDLLDRGIAELEDKS